MKLSKVGNFSLLRFQDHFPTLVYNKDIILFEVGGTESLMSKGVF
jgi:hypothetical protein